MAKLEAGNVVGGGIGTIVGAGLTALVITLSSGDKVELPTSIPATGICKDTARAAFDRVMPKVDPKDSTKTVKDTVKEPARIIIDNRGEAVGYVRKGQVATLPIFIDGVAVDALKFEPTIDLPEGQVYLLQARWQITAVADPKAGK